MTDAEVTEPTAKGLWRRLLSGVLGLAATVGMAYGWRYLAGRWLWREGIVFLAVMTVGQSAVGVATALRQKGLLKRRAGFGAGTKRWDVVCLSLMAVGFLAILGTAAWDNGRSGWGPMPRWWWGVGLGLFLGYVLLMAWAMRANRFFEKSVRIQMDQGHTVVTTGPYRYVRHPGYLGTLFGFVLSAPLLLGSLWAFVPAGFTALVLIVRTALEDRTLANELPGYREYQAVTRYRLMPWLW